MFNIVTSQTGKTVWLVLFHPFSMKIFMHIAELFIRNMGVNLGSGDVGVAEEGLDGTEVGAVG